MTNEPQDYDAARGRASAMNLGPNSEVPPEELAREAGVAGVVNPAGTAEPSADQDAVNRDRAQVISPGAPGVVPEAELARERRVAEQINPGPAR